MGNRWQTYLETLKTNFTKLSKLEFLQPDGSVAFSIDNNYKNSRSGAFIQDGSLSVNLQNGARRQATITLSNLDGAYNYNINNIWFGQQIRLQMGVLLPDGSEFYLPQGVFYIKDPEEAFRPDQKTVTYNLYDKWAYLDGTLFGNLDGIYEVPVNSSIYSGIASVLAFDRGNGYPVDSVLPLFTNYYNDMTTTLPDGTEIPFTLTPYTYRCDSENGTYADVILELNTMLAGWVGYDPTGRLRLDPSQDDILDSTKPILWEFTPSENQFLGASYTVKNTDVYNNIIVQGESLDNYGQVYGVAVNDDIKSDTNIFSSLGKRTLRLSASGYYSTQQCVDLAVFRLKRFTVLQKSVSISSSQMFHLMENNLVTVLRSDKPGSPVEKHLITGFTLPIGQTGEMVINATSVQDFPIVKTAPVITSGAQLPAASSGVYYFYNLVAQGSEPIVWSVASGSSLPSGMSISQAGLLSGTPSVAGSYAFSVVASNSVSAARKQFTISVAQSATAPAITTASPLTAGSLNTAYSVQFSADGTAPFTWTVTSGSVLPSGLSLSSSGVLSGTPSSTGTFSFSITASNSAGSGNKSFSLTVSSQPAPTTYYWSEYNVNTSVSYTNDSGWGSEFDNDVERISGYSDASFSTSSGFTGSGYASLTQAGTGSSVYTVSGDGTSASWYYFNSSKGWICRRDRSCVRNASHSQGSLLGTVSSTNYYAYPDNGVQGNYWYVRN